MSAVIRHAPGVYLNQSHEDYLEDCGLGYSSMSLLSRSPVEFWWASPWNPLRPEEKPKSAFTRGTALHTLFLYGLAEYERTCIVKPATYTDAKTGEIKRWNGNATVCKQWLEERDRPNVNIITAEDDAAIRLVHRMVFSAEQAMDVDGEKVRLGDAFQNGLHEVSVFWDTEDGIPMRARFDDLLPNLSADAKSITDWKKGDFRESLLREIVIRGYLTQAVHYNEARRQLRQFVAQGKVFGATAAQTEQLREIAEADAWSWAFVFLKLDGAPQARCILIDQEGPQYKLAEQRWHDAIAQFLYHREFFTMDQMWVDPMILWTPDHTAWPSWSVSGD